MIIAKSIYFWLVRQSPLIQLPMYLNRIKIESNSDNSNINNGPEIENKIPKIVELLPTNPNCMENES